MNKITPFLWFNNNAKEAMDFYVSVFKDSQVISENPMSVQFRLNNQEFMGLNAGPIFRFNEAVSFMVECKDQEEVNYYWNALIADGGEESQCGWLKDKFGLSWQIIPTRLPELLNDSNPDRAKKAMEAMLKMKKIVIAKLEEAVG